MISVRKKKNRTGNMAFSDQNFSFFRVFFYKYPAGYIQRYANHVVGDPQAQKWTTVRSKEHEYDKS